MGGFAEGLVLINLGLVYIDKRCNAFLFGYQVNLYDHIGCYWVVLIGISAN